MLRVITANRLSDGVVVYFDSKNRWTETFGAAQAFADASSLEDALERAKADAQANLVVDVVAVDARRTGGSLQPAHIREAIRASGPTVHRDHGKQAQTAATKESGSSV